MTVSEFFAGLAKRVGVPEDHAGLVQLLGMTATIPDDVTEKLSGLMTESEAKNNIKVKHHFISEFGDGIDKAIPKQLSELGLDQQLIDEIVAEKSTGKKATLALKKLHEAMEAKVKAQGNKDPEALAKANQQIKEANDLVNKTKQEYEAKLAEKDGFLTDYKKRNELEKLLSQHQWSDIYPQQTRGLLFDASLNEEMKKLGAVMQLEGDKLVLKQAADPALNFHYQNKEFTPSELVAKVMADNKFIAVAKQATEPLPMTGFRNQPPANGAGAKHAPNNFLDSLAASMADQGVQ